MQSPTAEYVLAAPPAGVLGAQLFGVPITDLVMWLNLIYIVLLLTYWVRNRVKEFFNGRKQ